MRNIIKKRRLILFWNCRYNQTKREEEVITENTKDVGSGLDENKDEAKPEGVMTGLVDWFYRSATRHRSTNSLLFMVLCESQPSNVNSNHDEFESVSE